MSPAGADGALPVRRSYEVDTPDLQGVVIQVDATETPTALAVLQASLHELPEGQRLVYGYDLSVVGLAAWVGDRRVRLEVWPALVDAAGDITADDPHAEGADLLVIDFDPVDPDHRSALEGLARGCRLFIAGPESGPVPLVLDIDPELVAEVLASTAG